MQDVLDVHARDCGTGDGGHQDAPDGVPDGDAVAAGERFQDELAVVAVHAGFELRALLIHWGLLV